MQNDLWDFHRSFFYAVFRFCGKRLKSTRSVLPRQGRTFRANEKFQKDLIGLVRICCLCVLVRGLQNLEAPLKGFNCCGAKLPLRCADSRFAKPRSFLKKVLIVAVRRCHCGGLNRGLQNLDILCKGNGLSLFASCKK